MTTPLPLDDIQARADAATVPPWKVCPDENTEGDTSLICCGGPEQHQHGGPIAAYLLTDADADFIAHARSDVPALVEECRRLRADLEEIRDAMTYPTFDDERIGYVEVQLDRDVWEKIKAEKDAVRAALEPRP